MAEQTGTVKWFSKQKGYGFIVPDGDGEGQDDVFVHIKDAPACGSCGTRTLKGGQVVTFDIVEGEKGPQAANVQIVSS